MGIRFGNSAVRLLSRSRANRRASILLVTLWVLFILAFFAVVLGYGVRQKLSLAMRLEQRDQARFISWANIQLAINEIKNNIYGQSVQISDLTDSSYMVFEEEGKLNINRVSAPILGRLFKIVLGYDDMQAQELAASIVDWRDKDSMLSLPLGSAEDSYYNSLTYPYDSKDADFDTLAEVCLVKGMTPEVFGKIGSYFTIYGEGLVNINNAKREVLLALGLSDYLATNIISFRCGKDKICSTKDDNYFPSVSQIAALLSGFCTLNEAQKQQIENLASTDLTVESNYFMIESIVNFPRRPNAYRSFCWAERSGKILNYQEF